MEINKEKVEKDDGRYLIYYTFDNNMNNGDIEKKINTDEDTNNTWNKGE